MRFSRPIRIFILAVVAIVATGACFMSRADEMEEPKLKIRAYKGWYKIVDEYGDTVRKIEMNEIVVYPDEVFKNKKEEEFFWRTVRDVRKTLPYAKAASKALLETYEYIQTIPDQKERDKHLATMEKDIVEQYKPAIMKLNKNQGKILLKLINRETDQSSFNIVKAFLGTFRAAFWQTVGQIFGMNMKAGFNPSTNDEDAVINRIATRIEQGGL